MHAVKQNVYLFQVTWIKGKAKQSLNDEKEGILGHDLTH